MDKYNPYERKVLGILNFKDCKIPTPKGLKATDVGQCVECDSAKAWVVKPETCEGFAFPNCSFA